MFKEPRVQWYLGERGPAGYHYRHKGNGHPKVPDGLTHKSDAAHKKSAKRQSGGVYAFVIVRGGIPGLLFTRRRGHCAAKQANCQRANALLVGK